MIRKTGGGGGGERNRGSVHWAMVPLLAGVLIGVALSTVFLLHPYPAVTNLYLELPGEEGRGAELRQLLRDMEAAHGAPSDGRSPVELADEADVRAPVHYAVVMNNRHSADQLKVLEETWTRGVPRERINFFIQSEREEREKEEDGHYGEIGTSDSVVELAGTSPDCNTEVVSHVCREQLNHTKWYLIAGDDVYVKWSELETLLQRYENSPGYGYLGRKRESSVDGGCVEEAGIILSQSVLHELCELLDTCGDIGRCLTETLGHSCNQLDSEGGERFLLLDTDLRGSVTEKENSGRLGSSLTLSPVPDSRTMYSIHQAVVGLRLNSTHHQIHSLKKALDRMTELLPHSLDQPTQREETEVLSTDDVVSWRLVGHGGLLSDEEYTPTRDVPGVWRTEMESMAEKALQYISTREDVQLEYKKVVNAYWRVEPLTAINYIVGFETSFPQVANGKPLSNHYRIMFTRPLNPPEISHTHPLVTSHVTVAVCFTSAHTDKLQQFLTRLSPTLDRGQKVNLMAIQMRSVSEKQKPGRTQSTTVDAKSLFSLYRSKYQSSSFSLLESPALLSRSHAIAIVLRDSRPSDLLFLADLDLQFEEGFLERCRNLPLQGQQVYFPIVFSLRDPSLLASLNHSLIEGSVNHHTGHWMVGSYSTACLYAGDLLSLSGLPEMKGMMNEVDMEEVYSALLGRGYEVLRAPDKQLKRVYSQERSCDLDLVGLNWGESCGERVESDEPLYLRTHLSALLFDHEGENSDNKY